VAGDDPSGIAPATPWYAPAAGLPVLPVLVAWLGWRKSVYCGQFRV